MASRILSLLLLPIAAQLVSAFPAQIAPLRIPNVPSHKLVDNRYVVVLKDSTPADTFGSHINLVEVAAQANPLWGANGFRHVWDGAYDSLMGYSGHFSEDVLDMIRRRPEVKYVEQVQVAEIAGVQDGSTWGLARLSHRDTLEKGSEYQYIYEGDEPGKDVTAYIIDTGIRLTHEEFEGRARWGTTIDPANPDADDHGHGTHVGGTVAGKTYGVAKHADLVAVKAFDKSGKGTSDDILAGVVWVDKDVSSLRAAGGGRKGSVINISLGAGQNDALDDGVRKAIEHGIVVVVSAGNDNADACDKSPADVAETITVGASTEDDTLWEHSNWGRCVDLFAPGHKIKSAFKSSDTATFTVSGTSMAAPHVAGVAAYLLSIYPHPTFNPQSASAAQASLIAAYSSAYAMLPDFVSRVLPAPDVFQVVKNSAFEQSLTPAQVKDAILRMATEGILDDTRGTDNFLLFNNATSANIRSLVSQNSWPVFY